MWEHVELREIRVFLALCEELHFGRTAERLGLSQTRVSQIVQDLERKLGAQVFERIVHPTGTTFASRYGHPDIVYVPLSGMPPCRSALLWRRGSADARVAAFARYAGALASELQSTTHAAVR